jgi:cell division protein FtsA
MASKSQPRYAAGVDAGSARTRCVICIVQDQRLRFLGAGSVPSQGWQRGRVADPDAISDSIHAAVNQAETRARVLIDSAVIGLGGLAIEAGQGHGLYEFGRPREIAPADLVYAVEQASRIRLEDDSMLVHVLPQDFTVDGRAGYRYPSRVTAARLEANVLLITTSEQEHECVVSAAHRAHLSVEDTVFESVAAAYACILPAERERGAAVIDLGMHSTGLVVYDADAAAGAASLPISSDHLTRDLVVGLQRMHGVPVSYEDAEMLKREYGCAMLGLTADNTLIDVPSSDGRGSREISRRQLNEILEARAEEIFLHAREEIRRSGMDHSLMEGVFLTGGGARLPGMLDMAEKILNCHAQFGLTAGILDWPRNFQDPAWTVAAGLSMYSARLKLQHSERRKPPGLLGLFGW